MESRCRKRRELSVEIAELFALLKLDWDFCTCTVVLLLLLGGDLLAEGLCTRLFYCYNCIDKSYAPPLTLIGEEAADKE